jgi:hypothetical protein
VIDITPQTDSDSQVTVGDTVRVKWLLDAQVSKSNLTLTVNGTTYSGADLTETTTTTNGTTYYRYYRDIELSKVYTQIQWELSSVNDATDTGAIQATPKIT